MPHLTDELKEKFLASTLALEKKIKENQASIGVANINLLDTQGRGLLHYAAALGDQNYAKKLLAQGANINIRTSNLKSGFSPLEVAVIFEQNQMIEFLLLNKIEINLDILVNIMPTYIRQKIFFHVHEGLTQQLKSDLFISALNDLLPFLEQAARIDATDIFEAIEKNEKHRHKFDYLVSEYSDKLLFSACQCGSTNICNYLLQKGVRITFPVYGPGTGQNPVNIAIRGGYWDIIILFLDNKYDINRLDHDGDSLLQSAILGKNQTCILNIINAGIDLKLENDNQEIFLHTLFKTDLAPELIGETLKLVLNKISRDKLVKLMQSQDIHGETPYHLAKKKGMIPLLESLNLYQKAIEISSIDEETNLDQSPLIKKIEIFKSLTGNNDIPFSPQGYCQGYSILLNLLGEKRFNAILHSFISWDETLASLNELVPKNASLRGLDIQNMRELFDEFIHCISWAQQTWLSLGGEIDIVKILNAFRVPYEIFCEVNINTSKKTNLEEFLDLFMKCPPGTRVLLLGDAHACSMFITEDHRIKYRDPNHKRALPLYDDVKALSKMIHNTKMKSSGRWSSTNFVVFSCGEQSLSDNASDIKNKVDLIFEEFVEKNKLDMRGGFAKNPHLLMSAPTEPPVKSSHAYKEEEMYERRPPALWKFFTIEEREKLNLQPDNDIYFEHSQKG